ncbi:hypothetical protein R3P38DRAFT_2575379, partial [Favolaschia claudopus]
VSDHVESWIKAAPAEFRGKESQLRLQLTFEANVVEYVALMYAESRHHGNSKATGPKTLPKGFPILGPRFVPPSLLEAKKRTPAKIEPNTLYIRPLNVVHPFYHDNLCCPQCDSMDIKWDSWTGGGARGVVHGVRCEERAIGYQLRCNECKKKYGQGGSEAGAKGPDDERLGYSFATTNPKFWAKRQHWEIPRGVPIFFHRCALTRELFDLIVELRPSTTSGKLAENIKQLHLLEYKQRELEYLEAFRTRFIPSFNFGPAANPLQEFSAPHDTSGYNDESITDDLITDIFIEFSDRTRAVECSRYLRTLKAICINLDTTFKATKKATVVDSTNERSNLMKGGILSVLNEVNQIISWRFCQSESTKEIVELLEGLKKRFSVMGVDSPEMVREYGAVILNGSRNPRRSEVLKDLRNAVIKEPANKHAPARYWSQPEQVIRLSDAYDKWATRGGVWSAAAQNVHDAQMNHARRGCLARPRDDIASDGSRIEGSHKGWNSLQRAVASGLGLHTALGHDYVLRRNISVALTGKTKYDDPFVKSTFGSHHIGLVDHTAGIWNALLTPGTVLIEHPRLKDIPSTEKFGIVQSSNADTFDGLFTIKPEPDDDDIEGQVLEELDSEVQGQVYAHQRAVLMQEFNLDPKSFEEPLKVDASQPKLESTSRAIPTIPVVLTASSTSQHVQTISVSDYNSYPRGLKRKETAEDSLETPSTQADDSLPKEKKARLYPIFAAPSPSQPVPSTSTTPPVPEPQPITALTTTSPKSIAELNKPLPVPRNTLGKLTPSQLLFESGTGINPLALKITYGEEFYLFMKLRTERQWKSFEMTPKRWAEETVLYNSRLKSLPNRIPSPKHPRALVEKLTEIEPKIILRIRDKNYKSASGKTAYWTQHCGAVSLIKIEAGASSEGSSASGRKPQTCSRCKALKYPGKPGSPENHKKLFCSDGFRPTLPQETVAPWPLPSGIFTDGIHFRPFAFLTHVREVYTRLFVENIQRDNLSLEDDAFMRLLNSRVVVVRNGADGSELDGAVLFRMFATFSIPDTDNFPDDLIIDYNGSKHLFINSLRESPPQVVA